MASLKIFKICYYDYGNQAIWHEVILKRSEVVEMNILRATGGTKRDLVRDIEVRRKLDGEDKDKCKNHE